MMPGRTRKHLTKEDKERIKHDVNVRGVSPAVVAEWYGIAEFTVRKICGII